MATESTTKIKIGFTSSGKALNTKCRMVYDSEGWSSAKHLAHFFNSNNNTDIFTRDISNVSSLKQTFHNCVTGIHTFANAKNNGGSYSIEEYFISNEKYNGKYNGSNDDKSLSFVQFNQCISMDSTFDQCNKLKYFLCGGLPKVISASYCFDNCDLQNGWKCDLPKLQYAPYMFSRNPNLKEFHGATPNLKIANGMFSECEKLHTFDGDLSQLLCGHAMFYKTALNLKSLQHISKSIKDINPISSNIDNILKIKKENPTKTYQQLYNTLKTDYKSIGAFSKAKPNVKMTNGKYVIYCLVNNNYFSGTDYFTGLKFSASSVSSSGAVEAYTIKNSTINKKFIKSNLVGKSFTWSGLYKDSTTDVYYRPVAQSSMVLSMDDHIGQIDLTFDDSTVDDNQRQNSRNKAREYCKDIQNKGWRVTLYFKDGTCETSFS